MNTDTDLSWEAYDESCKETSLRSKGYTSVAPAPESFKRVFNFQVAKLEIAGDQELSPIAHIAPSPQQVNFLEILKLLTEYFRSGNCSKACEMSITQLISGKAVSSHCLCTRFSDKADGELSGTLMGMAWVVHFWRGNITIPPPSSTTRAPKN
ncbi:unnamed protein product, partial [Mesorhabditis belari]|uniref:Uncharacterized protein n=1 Tax=Mesorhabditis belari TaxID=2138241 RepID=A0AAF3ECH8_9BILA